MNNNNISIKKKIKIILHLNKRSTPGSLTPLLNQVLLEKAKTYLISENLLDMKRVKLLFSRVVFSEPGSLKDQKNDINPLDSDVVHKISDILSACKKELSLISLTDASKPVTISYKEILTKIEALTKRRILFKTQNITKDFILADIDNCLCTLEDSYNNIACVISVDNILEKALDNGNTDHHLFLNQKEENTISRPRRAKNHDKESSIDKLILEDEKLKRDTEKSLSLYANASEEDISSNFEKVFNNKSE